jgi:hypothetical protein
MPRFMLRLLTARSLERWRARVPYAIATAAVTFVAGLGASPALACAIALALPWTPIGLGIALVGALTVPTIAALGILTLMTPLHLVGWVSGHRPFRAAWPVQPDQERVAAVRAQEAIARAGFDVVWSSEREVVAVKNMALESSTGLTHDGARFPMRLWFAVARGRATLRISSRTVVFWDSGERETLQREASPLLRDLGIDPGHAQRA